MRPRPDLSYPGLPDADELPHPHSARKVENGGTSLRDDNFQWPEAGPSESSKAKGLDGAESRRDGLGPFGAKAAAAMTGAVATSLLMTPFDVLKTRLQTVQPQPQYPKPQLAAMSEECCQTTVLTSQTQPRLAMNTGSNPLTCLSSNEVQFTGRKPATFSTIPSSAMPMEAPQGCLHPSRWAGIWGEPISMDQAMTNGAGRSRGGAATLLLPMEAQAESVIGGFWNEVATVRRETGVRGLWKGVGTTLTMAIPSSAIYMLGYEYLLQQISPLFTGTTDATANTSSLNRPASSDRPTAQFTPAPLVAGSLARTLSATVISPIEMFRTRLQALPTANHAPPTYASTATEMRDLVRGKGLTILWRGLGPTLWRDVPFSGIYWAGFEIIKSKLASETSPLPPLSPITTSFISGALSGTVSALVTQPFDVLKTRRQVFTPSPDCLPAAVSHRASTLPLALHVIKTEGWSALFAGTVPRCGKVAPACGLMIACYEGVGRYLGGRD